jgi:simple sugar transport system ATP-binding protein
MSTFVVEMKNITKHFGQVQAVKLGHIQVAKGEIHSLIGENGAGKSTMMKLLYGLYPHDEGEIWVHGDPIEHMTPKKAISMGIGMVHQEFMLVEELTVLENILLGFEPKKGLVVDFGEGRKRVQQFIDQYGLDIEMDKRINQISVGEAQRVEIIKCLSRGADFIILDEPTAVLTPQETKRLFEVLERLKEDGKSVVFISHKLDEVMTISDRITVMRQGEVMGTVEKSATNPTELTKMMIGREVFLNIKKTDTSAGKKVLEVKDLWTSGEKEISKIRGISFDVKESEIVGIAGIDGNGQSELIEAITGLRAIEKGDVILDGEVITNKTVSEIRNKGLTHIPEDRNTRGLNRHLNIWENIFATHIKDSRFTHNTILDMPAAKQYANELANTYDIRPRNTDAATASLSGGNAQKVVVAREVDMGGKLLVASQPTRGVDIGAIESIRSILENVKAEGRGVLLVSADLEEILSLSDRIIVMYEGKISGVLKSEDATDIGIGYLMMGGNKEEVNDA